jgi:hypothetical protein
MRRKSVSLGWRDMLDIQADRLASLDLLVDLFGESGSPRHLDAPGLMEWQGSARIAAEAHDFGHAAHSEVCHNRVSPDLLRKTRRPRRRLRGYGVPIEQRYATTPLCEVERDAGAKRPGANYHCVSFVKHGPSPQMTRAV